MRVNADSLLIRAAATSTSGTLNDLTTDLIMANNNSGVCPQIQGRQCGAYVGAVEKMMCVVCVSVIEGHNGDVIWHRICVRMI